MIYIVRAGESGPVKIGVAEDVERRLSALQTGSFEALRVVRTIEGGTDLELALHRHYARLRIRGEWFSWCDTMLTVEPADVAVDPEPAPKKQRTPVQRLFDGAGGAAKIAALTGWNLSTVTYWGIRNRVPADRILALEDATGFSAREWLLASQHAEQSA